MNWKRYFLNLFRSINRVFSGLTGGDPEEPNSSRWGKLRERRKWARVLCKILSFLYREDDHCGNAAAKEDDGFRASDPEGKYFIPLALFWLGLIIWSIAVHIEGWPEFVQSVLVYIQ